MVQIKKLVFNAFRVNTYILFDETKQCVIIDAACSSNEEEAELAQFIDNQKLVPVLLLNTHAHIDHVLGNEFVSDRFNLKLKAHSGGEMYLMNGMEVAATFGMRLNKVIYPDSNIEDDQILTFGKSRLKVLFTPGHAAGSVSFYCEEQSFVITGDVLFYQSIGRTDLPGGDYDILKKSIWSKLFVLPDQTIVYPGHGPETNIGNEKTDNPFVAIG